MDKNVDFPVVSLQKKSNESNDIKKDKINSKSTIQKHTHFTSTGFSQTIYDKQTPNESSRNLNSYNINNQTTTNHQEMTTKYNH